MFQRFVFKLILESIKVHLKETGSDWKFVVIKQLHKAKTALSILIQLEYQMHKLE